MKTSFILFFVSFLFVQTLGCFFGGLGGLGGGGATSAPVVISNSGGRRGGKQYTP
jgi:hypothetical protein